MKVEQDSFTEMFKYNTVFYVFVRIKNIGMFETFNKLKNYKELAY